MDKKFYFLAGVLSVVLVVSLFSLVTAWPWWSKDVQNAPPTGNIDIINAHQCKADGVCEMNGLIASGTDGNPIKLGVNTQTQATVLAVSSGAEPEVEIRGDLEYTGNLIGLDCAVMLIVGSGVPTCANAGYTSCIAEEIKDFVTYLDSTNSSCAGNIQVEMKDYRIGSCTNQTGTGNAGCGKHLNGAEPYRGDFISGSEQTPQGGKVLCCR